jgi:small subunit ribosomal protein S29
MNSSFAYSKVANTTSFAQPLLASNLVGQIHNVNKSVLDKINTSEDAVVGRHDIPKGTSLSALLEVGVKDQFASQDVMEFFMKEISNQKEYVYQSLSYYSKRFKRTLCMASICSPIN